MVVKAATQDVYETVLEVIGESLQEWRKQAMLPQQPESLQQVYVNQEVAISMIESDVKAMFQKFLKGENNKL